MTVSVAVDITRGARTLLSLILFLVCVLGGLCGCKATPQNPTVEIGFFPPAEAKGPSFQVEVVASPSTRAHGLMFRRELAEREGMLFVFPDEKIQSFWMKNTLIPLDMVFVSKEMKVVGILENVPPLTEDSRFVESPSIYVLEFAGGAMKKFGVKPGFSLEIRGQLPKAF